MRIALVSQEYPPETAKGGLGTQTFLKAHGLAALGHEVHVLSRSPAGERTECRDGRVTVIRIPGRERSLSLHSEVADWLTYSVEVAAAIEALHARSPLDLVDVPEWAAEGYVHLLNRTPWNGLPTVVQLHGPLVMLAHTLAWPDLESEFYRTGSAMEQTCLRLADAVFSSSRCSVEWCARHYGLAGETIPILHAGVDTEQFCPRPVPKAERPTIIFVGRLVPNKGVRLLVEAAGRLAHELPDLQLRVLGRGEPGFVDELRARAAAVGLKNALDLPGAVDHGELPDHLSRAHVFAAPSRYEGGPGFVYLEAMACGLPVIACSGSGAAEVVRDEQTGLLVPPDDLEALAVALRRLLGDEPKRQALGDRARRYVLESADSRVCRRELERFYLKVLDRVASRAENR
jgi:glycosyltransferase involved in cell wall biosynthesis